MKVSRKYIFALIISAFGAVAFAQQGSEHNHTHGEGDHHDHAHEAPAQAQQPANAAHAHEAEADHGACGHPASEDPKDFNAGETAIHHIADVNAIHIYGDTYFHLPCILYAPNHGWKLTSTSVFKMHHHGNGTVAKDGYVLVHGSIMRIQDAAFPMGEVAVSEPTHDEVKTAKGKDKTIYYVQANGVCYMLDAKTTLDGGLMGGGITSFYDFSITRNVFTMLLTFLLLFLLLRSAAKAYTSRPGQAPKGIQNFFEPFITFIRDDVAKPNIGPNYERYMPYLLSSFFFILGLNLIGQIPFFPGSANVTGNISVTMVLAIITFLIVSFSGNANYWRHIFAMPGVPKPLLIILTPVEVLGAILKPFTLMLRLFANITAGHIVIISFVSLIFIFTNKFGVGTGTAIGAAASIPLTLFMMALELLVALLQAFIFTMLSATYIGSAIEEHHH